jgi:hypothetical protein
MAIPNRERSGLWLKSVIESGLQRKSAAVELPSGGLSEKRCCVLSPLFPLCRVENMGRRMLSVFPLFEWVVLRWVAMFWVA